MKPAIKNKNSKTNQCEISQKSENKTQSSNSVQEM